MRSGLAKYLPLLVISAVMVATNGTALADSTNKPFIKTYGADLMTGGWFMDNGVCPGDPTTTNYQDPSYKTSSFAGDTRDGGILTYVRNTAGVFGGSSSQYGVQSLGEVDGRRGGDGFYSDGANPSFFKKLTFANTDNTLPYGGEFEGTIPQGHCIPDYFSKVDPTNPSVNTFDDTTNWTPVFNGGGGGGTYYRTMPKGTVDNLFNNKGPSPMSLKPGKRVVIAVDGSVYIDRNIIYDNSSTVDNVPKFTLLVRGSIYVDPNVNELDGLYIAQPADSSPASVSNDTGVFWSCHPPTSNPIDIHYPPTCLKTLVVKGAVIAKQADLIRVRGDVGFANPGEDNLFTVTACLSPNPCNQSEVFDYTPAMIMGGSFFDTSSGGGGGSLKIDSLISLPPVF